MKALLLSDIHVDLHEEYANNRKRYSDPTADIVENTMSYLWNFYKIPDTEAIILAGDFSNDFGRFTHIIPWLSRKYEKVYLVLGNHDLTCRGATDSKSNLQFTCTENKIAHMKECCRQFDNIYFMDEENVRVILKDRIGGCTGFCDFKCEPPTYGLDPYTKWRRQWYDGKYMRYFNQEPQRIWNHYDEALSKIIALNPRIVVTHFVPYQLGVSFDFRNDPWNYVFYFDAEKYLEEMPDDSYWFCGHVHGRRKAEYVNSKGNRIHIWCNPLGYPGERSRYIELLDYTGEKLERGSVDGSDNDFIIDL